MVCRSVQVLRPRSSTSGGQSAGGAREEVSVDGGVLLLVLVVDVVLVEEEEGEGEWETFFIRAAQSAEVVQDRHLECGS